MRLLVCGSDKIFSIENFYVKYLREAGVEVIRFAPKNIFYDYYRKGIVNKILFRLGLSSIYKIINNEFVSLVEKEKPSIIWVFKGMEIFPETLNWVKDHEIKLANYNPDNPFVFTGRGSGNANITKSIGLYDLHFTYNLLIKSELENKYGIKTCLLPFAFDIPDGLYKACLKVEEVVKTCFLGNPDKKRADFVLQLADLGIEIDVYGHGWDNFVKHKMITICPPVYGDEQWKVLRKYRVQLNLMRIHNENSHNMRTFEVPGIGGIQLAPDTPEHRMFFSEGIEIFLFKAPADCALQIQKLLALSPAEAMTIRQAARARCLDSGYRYEDRAMQVLAELKQLE